jgi:ribose-phosphate pyrophosphokinase
MTTPRPVLFSLEPHMLAHSLAQKLPCDLGEFQSRAFPDGESYLKITTPVQGKDCMILVDLSHPDGKFLPLVFLADTLREMGARSVGLVAPYLCYMRQDRRFVDGEAVTSRIFAGLVSEKFDWLVTVDPHLHRYHSLDEIYAIPSRVVQGAPVLSEWLSGETDIFLVGPDAESEQWVSSIAAISGHPYVIGEKNRLGDRQVVITLPDLGDLSAKRAVIIDDVISSGHTVLECISALREKGVKDIDCACIHGIFVDDVDQQLVAGGLNQLVSCNTIIHESNRLDISRLLKEPMLALIGGTSA